MSEWSGAGTVLIIDRMSLRRTLLLKFVENWAATNGLTVISSSDFSDIVHLRNPPSCRLIIFSIGGELLAKPETVSTQQVVKALYPSVPLVIMGESTHPKDIEAVICSDASAYISSCLNAEVALAALSFVLAGGSYFPTEALKSLNASGMHLPRNPPGQHYPTLDDSNAEMGVAGDVNASFEPDGARQQVSGLAEEALRTASAERSASCCLSVNPVEDAEQRLIDREHSLTDNDNATTCRIDKSDDLLDNAGTADLTARQHQVLACLKNGLPNKQIARDLDMSEATVKVHVRHIMKKLGASNRTQAVVLALDTAAKEQTSMAVTPPSIQASAWKRAARVN